MKKETPDCGKHCKPPKVKFGRFKPAKHCNKKCCHGRSVSGHYRGKAE